MKKWMILLCVAILSLSLVACSGKDKNSSDQTDTVTPATADVPSPSSDPEQAEGKDPSGNSPDDEFSGLDVQDEVVIELEEGQGVGGL